MTDDSDIADRDSTERVRQILWATLVANCAVAATKIGYGYAAGIISLQADGFHTTFDALANVIGLVALGIAKQPPDVEHPYGHRKLEVAASLVIGLLVLLGLVEVGRAVWNSTGDVRQPVITTTAYGVVVATIVVNLMVSGLEHWAGERYNSMILKADAAHTLADSLAAVSVLAGMYLVQIGIAVGDLLAALAVMLFIGMTAYRVLREGLDVIVDSSQLDPRRVRAEVESIEPVESCHYVRSRGMPGHIHLDLHVTLDPETKLTEAGDILLEVKSALYERYSNLEDVLIQIEPHADEHVDDVPEQLI